MPQLQPKVREALQVLAAHSAVGGLICSAVASGRLSGTLDFRQISSFSGIAQSRAGEVLAFLEAAQRLGFFARISEFNWQASDTSFLAELAPMLQAISFYCAEIHQDQDTVDVVLTKPPHPSQLTQALDRMLLGTWGLLNTREVLPSIAEKANVRLAVMTPFLDEMGGQILLTMFSNAKHSIRKQLILRMSPDGLPPSGYTAVAHGLMALGVETYNFRLEKEEISSTETFHAKLVLADSDTAYVGSSNMNKWSFQYSLEVGLMVSGRAAKRIGQIVDAVISVAIPVTR